MLLRNQAHTRLIKPPNQKKQESQRQNADHSIFELVGVLLARSLGMIFHPHFPHFGTRYQAFVRNVNKRGALAAISELLSPGFNLGQRKLLFTNWAENFHRWLLAVNCAKFNGPATLARACTKG
ncbi:MAG: hypothetical protein JNJ50_21615 [Acidobacteria bacterium]|nr:hypothetical protein [Acidobacteriota bacterium]